MTLEETLQQLEAHLYNLRTEKDRIECEARKLSDAYVRLRTMIPGALDTPFAPSAEQVWAHTEACLRKFIS